MYWFLKLQCKASRENGIHNKRSWYEALKTNGSIVHRFRVKNFLSSLWRSTIIQLVRLRKFLDCFNWNIKHGNVWEGNRAKLVILLPSVSCHFYNAKKFAFGFVFHHSTTMLVDIHAMLLLWWLKFLEFYLLDFCFVFYFIDFIMLNLSIVYGVCFFGCCDLLCIILFLGATYIGGATFRNMEGIFEERTSKS